MHPPSPMPPVLKCFLFWHRAVEVVVASSLQGIEEPAPAQPNDPFVASPDASAGNSCRLPCDAHLSLATQAACLP